MLQLNYNGCLRALTKALKVCPNSLYLGNTFTREKISLVLCQIIAQNFFCIAMICITALLISQIWWIDAPFVISMCLTFYLPWKTDFGAGSDVAFDSTAFCSYMSENHHGSLQENHYCAGSLGIRTTKEETWSPSPSVTWLTAVVLALLTQKHGKRQVTERHLFTSVIMRVTTQAKLSCQYSTAHDGTYICRVFSAKPNCCGLRKKNTSGRAGKSKFY